MYQFVARSIATSKRDGAKRTTVSQTCTISFRHTSQADKVSQSPRRCPLDRLNYRPPDCISLLPLPLPTSTSACNLAVKIVGHFGTFNLRLIPDVSILRSRPMRVDLCQRLLFLCKAGAVCAQWKTRDGKKNQQVHFSLHFFQSLIHSQVHFSLLQIQNIRAL